MSRPEEPRTDHPDLRDFTRLETAVARLLERMDGLRERTRAAEARVQDVEELLRRFTRGDDDPARLVERLKATERENADLRARLEQGREGVERLLARIRFLEDQA